MVSSGIKASALSSPSSILGLWMSLMLRYRCVWGAPACIWNANLPVRSSFAARSTQATPTLPLMAVQLAGPPARISERVHSPGLTTSPHAPSAPSLAAS